MQCARDIMNEDVVTVSPKSTVEEAIELLLDQCISGLPVTDPEGKLIGIVTEFALLAIAYDESVLKESVDKHMTTDLITVNPQDSIRTVADLCLVHRVRRLPVVQEGRLVGLIARRDVLQGVYEAVSASC